MKPGPGDPLSRWFEHPAESAEQNAEAPHVCERSPHRLQAPGRRHRRDSSCWSSRDLEWYVVDVNDFEQWYRTEHPRLLASLTLVSGDPDLAGEAVDEALARALERWERVRAMDSPGGWVYTVALHQLRRRQ